MTTGARSRTRASTAAPRHGTRKWPFVDLCLLCCWPAPSWKHRAFSARRTITYEPCVKCYFVNLYHWRHSFMVTHAVPSSFGSAHCRVQCGLFPLLPMRAVHVWINHKTYVSSTTPAHPILPYCVGTASQRAGGWRERAQHSRLPTQPPCDVRGNLTVLYKEWIVLLSCTTYVLPGILRS